MKGRLDDDASGDGSAALELDHVEQRIIEERSEVGGIRSTDEHQPGAADRGDRVHPESVRVVQEALGSRVLTEGPQHGHVLPRSARVHVLAP
jgi:hypothetical protein